MWSSARAAALVGLFCVLPAGAPAARAEVAPATTAPEVPKPRPAARTGPWHLSAGAGTDFPLAIGGRLVVEAPYRLRFSTSVGFMPGAYVDTINAAVVASGGYDETTARVVKSALQRSLVWRTHAGVRLWRGLYLEAGYGLVTLGGAAVGSDILVLVTGQPVSVTLQSDRPFHVDATVHMVDGELGYDFGIGARWRLRAAIGGAFAVATAARVDVESASAFPQLAVELARRAGDQLAHELRSYGNTPVVSLSVAYAFF